MSNEPRDKREERALDALTAAALRQGEAAEVTDEEIREFLSADLQLSPEGKAALDELGPGVIRALAGRSPSDQQFHDAFALADAYSPQFAAMHRKNTTGQNSAATEEQLERKRKEILDRLRKKKEPGS